MTIKDVEKIRYLYKDEFPIEVELWDTVGVEKFNENYMYSQSYLQGKHGIVFIVDAIKFIQEPNY